MRLPDSLARAKAGNNIAARMAMMAITTSNSINVNAPAPLAGLGWQSFVKLFIFITIRTFTAS
jgi:hypothetical protein